MLRDPKHSPIKGVVDTVLPSTGSITMKTSTVLRSSKAGMKVNSGAVREMLSQMVKDGQLKNFGRGAYVYPTFQEYPDNADILTNGKGNVSLSGMSGHSRKDETR